jgi:hypothetical protein
MRIKAAAADGLRNSLFRQMNSPAGTKRQRHLDAPCGLLRTIADSITTSPVPPASNPVAKAPCRHRHQVDVSLRMELAQLHCGSQAFNQRCFVKRLAQKADRSAIKRLIAVVLTWIGGDQNYWRAMALRPQHFLQLKAVEAGHLQVGNQACRLRDRITPKEMLGRAESNGFVSQRLDELPYTISGQRVIIDDRDQWVFTSQDCTGSRL